jgi:acyl dehydratase
VTWGMGESKTWAYEDFAVGQRFLSDFSVSPELVSQYLEVQGYASPVFTDAGLARELGFDAVPVPPGLATTYQFIATVPGVKLPAGGFYAKQEFRILGPCYAGDTLHTITTVQEKYERRGHRYISFDSTTSRDGGEPVIWGRRTRAWPD